MPAAESLMLKIKLQTKSKVQAQKINKMLVENTTTFSISIVFFQFLKISSQAGIFQ